MARTKPGRDALGNFFFYTHLTILAFVVLGWSIPARGPLLFYLVFLPALALHWKLNRNACALNNLESWLRYRRWRAPEKNAEEGAWLRTLIARVTGLALGRGQMDIVIYGCMILFWLLGLHHLKQFQGP